jgi:hypothetical protein
MTRAQFPEQKLSREEGTIEVLRRRRAGISYEKIHAELGVLPSTAHRWVQKALREATGRRTAEVEVSRTEQIGRLEELLAAVWPKATQEASVMHVAEARRLVLAIADLTGARSPIQVSWGLADVQRAIDAVDSAIAGRTVGTEIQPPTIEGEAS